MRVIRHVDVVQRIPLASIGQAFLPVKYYILCMFIVNKMAKP